MKETNSDVAEFTQLYWQEGLNTEEIADKKNVDVKKYKDKTYNFDVPKTRFDHSEEPWKSGKVLRDLHREQGIEVSEIANLMDVKEHVIRFNLRSLGIDIHDGDIDTELDSIKEKIENSDHPWRDEKIMYDLHWDRLLSSREISRRFGVTKQTVTQWLERLGIEKRDQSEHHTAQSIKESVDPMNDNEILSRLYNNHGLSAGEMVKYLPIETAQAVYHAMDRNGVERRDLGTATQKMWNDREENETEEMIQTQVATDGGLEVENDGQNIDIEVPDDPSMVRRLAEELSGCGAPVTIKITAYNSEVPLDTADPVEKKTRDKVEKTFNGTTYLIGSDADINARKTKANLPCIVPGSKVATVALEIHESGPSQVRDIAQRTNVTATYVATVANNLHERGLLSVQKSTSTNGSTNLYKLTEAGDDALSMMV